MPATTGTVCRYRWDGTKWQNVENCGPGTCKDELKRPAPGDGDPTEVTEDCGDDTVKAGSSKH